MVQDKEIQDDAVYRFITLNFIAEGGDNILSDVKFESMEYSTLVFRDFIIDEIKKITKEGKSVSDGFIR